MTIFSIIYLTTVDNFAFAETSTYSGNIYEDSEGKHNGENFSVHYNMQGGTMDCFYCGIFPQIEDKSLDIWIQTTNTKASLTVTIPRSVLDARSNSDGISGDDRDFVVVVDQKRQSFSEISADSLERTLNIPVPYSTMKIKIIGTSVINSIPETSDQSKLEESESVQNEVGSKQTSSVQTNGNHAYDFFVNKNIVLRDLSWSIKDALILKSESKNLLRVILTVTNEGNNLTYVQDINPVLMMPPYQDYDKDFKGSVQQSLLSYYLTDEICPKFGNLKPRETRDIIFCFKIPDDKSSDFSLFMTSANFDGRECECTTPKVIQIDDPVSTFNNDDYIRKNFMHEYKNASIQLEDTKSVELKGADVLKISYKITNLSNEVINVNYDVAKVIALKDSSGVYYPETSSDHINDAELRDCGMSIDDETISPKTAKYYTSCFDVPKNENSFVLTFQNQDLSDCPYKDTYCAQKTFQISKPVLGLAMPNSKGCLIATATYGTELSPQVQLLREVRDNVLFGTNSGTAFMMGFNEFYYSFSPVIADWERQSPLFKETVKLTITPMLSTMSILNHANIHSEQQMLGYGIGVILLNIGMYFAAPAIIIVKIQQRLRKA